MSKIQGFKMPGTVLSMDWNANNKFFIAGGKQAIKIVEFSPQKQYWFDCKKTINKHKGAQMTKVCVSELAWNKTGNDLVAIGTTSGYVFVYDVQLNSPKATLAVKGHDGNNFYYNNFQGNIKNIVWLPQSRDCFISSSYQNQINVWDLRVKQRSLSDTSPQSQLVQKSNVAHIQYPQSIKIRDIRFNPKDPNILAIQCSSSIKIVDFRMLKEQIVNKRIKDNELQGYMMQWDPHDKYRLASGVSKQINILKWQANDLILEQSLAHYSLIKQFKWLSTKKNFFGISGQNPQKNICFYDLLDKDRVSYIYGGHSKSIDYWMTDESQNIILSASNAKQKNNNNASNLKSSTGMIVAQYSDNLIDPNQARFQHPLALDCNSNLTFSLTISDPQIPPQYKNTRKYKYSFPTIYVQYEQTSNKLYSNLKQQLIFFHKHYLYQGQNDVITLHNSQLALNCEKQICYNFWKILFIIAYPEQNKDHSLESLYEEKIDIEIKFVENRILLNNKNLLKKEVSFQKRFQMLNQLIQFMADENQLQTAVVASIVLINKSPKLINEDVFQQIFQPYIEILRNLQLYSIASETVLMLSKFEKFSEITTKNTIYKITCGWCKQSVTKGDCKCNLLCVICQQRLGQRMVIWCKYCGHGGHAKEYKEWFKKNKLCPHGCDHECFKEEQFY